MKKRKVVSEKNLPTRLPVWSSLIVWLLLDRFNPPGWAWGVVGTVFVFFWIVAITDIFVREDVELFKADA